MDLSSNDFISGMKLNQNPENYFNYIISNFINLNENEVSYFYLTETLRRNPLHTNSLIKLAELTYYENKHEISGNILLTAQSYSKMSFHHNWEIGLLAFQLGMNKLFYRNFRNMVYNDFFGRPDALEQAYILIDDDLIFYNNITGEKWINHYIRYLPWNRIDDFCSIVSTAIKENFINSIEQDNIEKYKKECV